jgi:drug/metabolite transporter (DMT)-like permease
MMCGMTQRARSVTAKQERERAILDAARSLASERSVREVTLTDIAAAVGLHKSAMLRYFETREQIFLFVTAEIWQEWSASVRAELATAERDDVAALLARSFVSRPLFCDLLGQAPMNLERNVSLETVYRFKTVVLGEVANVQTSLRQLGISEHAAALLTTTAASMAGALWQMAAPGTHLREFYRSHPELGHAVVDVEPQLTAILTALLKGSAASRVWSERHRQPRRGVAVQLTGQKPGGLPGSARTSGEGAYMNGFALSLVLVAAVVHAIWNLAAKRVGDGGSRFVFLYYTVSAVVFGPFAVAQLVLERPQWTWLPAALGTAVLHVVYSIVLQRGYAVGDLSVVYPLARGTGPLLSVLVAVLFLGEHPGWPGLVGAFLVIAGVLVISSGKAAHVVPARRRAGVFYGVLTGAMIAAYTLWDAHSVNALGIPPLAYFGTGAIFQSLLLAPSALRSRASVVSLWRQHRRQVLTVGLLSPLGYLLVLYALQMAPVSLVAPARELSIVLGGLAAWRLLGEAQAARRLIGSLVVLAGIAAIAIA